MDNSDINLACQFSCKQQNITYYTCNTLMLLISNADSTHTHAHTRGNTHHTLTGPISDLLGTAAVGGGAFASCVTAGWGVGDERGGVWQEEGGAYTRQEAPRTPRWWQCSRSRDAGWRNQRQFMKVYAFLCVCVRVCVCVCTLEDAHVLSSTILFQLVGRISVPCSGSWMWA